MPLTGSEKPISFRRLNAEANALAVIRLWRNRLVKNARSNPLQVSALPRNSEMRDVTSSNFGIVIAYFVPGLTAVWGISQHYPPLRSWLAAGPADTPTIGGFLYVTVAAITAGLLVSTLRWAVVDTIHHRTGLPPPEWDFAKLPRSVEAFGMLLEAHYRYYQFYANMCVALALAYLAWRSSWTPRGSQVIVADLAVVLLELVLFAGSRDALQKYYHRVYPFLRRHRPAPRRTTLRAEGRRANSASGHQIDQPHLQRLGQPVDVHQRDVPLAALDAADIRAVQPSQFPQTLLLALLDDAAALPLEH